MWFFRVDRFFPSSKTKHLGISCRAHVSLASGWGELEPCAIALRELVKVTLNKILPDEGRGGEGGRGDGVCGCGGGGVCGGGCTLPTCCFIQLANSATRANTVNSLWPELHVLLPQETAPCKIQRFDDLSRQTNGPPESPMQPLTVLEPPKPAQIWQNIK